LIFLSSPRIQLQCPFGKTNTSSEYPAFLSQPQFEEYMDSYAREFDLYRSIEFNASVKRVVRNDDGSKWRLEFQKSGTNESREFDKVVLCHGYQTKAEMPTYEGSELFEGELIHAQSFRRSN
jgi:dimethylaniline monooxygenase (N-oxide forming)